MKKPSFSRIAAGTLLAVGMFSGPAALATATMLDLRGGDATHGRHASSGKHAVASRVEVSPAPEPDASGLLAVGLGLICFRRRPKVNPKLG